MQRRFTKEKRNGLLLCLFVLGAIAAVAVLPNYFRSSAGNRTGLINRTTSSDAELPKMWDIREAKGSDGLPPKERKRCIFRC